MIDNPLKPGSHNADLEAELETLPDSVANALLAWRITTLDREKTEALLYARFRADSDKTIQEIKSLINASPERYKACLDEIKNEATYNRLYERLLSAKKLASLRTAF